MKYRGFPNQTLTDKKEVMTEMGTTISDNQKKEKAKEEAKPWIRRFARVGYLSKGFVYVLVGILALMAALGIGGRATGAQGTLRSLAGAPFGEILLWLIGLGLIGYIVWDFIRAVKDPDKIGKHPKGTAKRILYLVTSIIYAFLAYSAITIAMESVNSSGSSAQQTLSARILAHSWGQWLFVAIGLIVIGYGIYQIYKGLSAKFMHKFKRYEMEEHETKLTKTSGMIGLTARGVVFILIGYFFIQTALTVGSQPIGLDRALSEIAAKPFGQWMLGIIAAGLVLYGAYEIFKSRFEYMDFDR